MAFSNSAVINYPVEKVFNVFIRAAKKDFPKFNADNPVGLKISKKVGYYSSQSATLEVEIVGYKKNELYAITSTSSDRIYYSTYKFEVVGENNTRITLEESDKSKGFVSYLNVIIQTLVFKGRVKRRFTYFIENLQREIERFDEKLAKTSKNKSDEEAKVKAKEEAKKAAKLAKEEALRQQKAAEEARIKAEKALKEAEAMEEALK
ncbi:MAG: DUF3284 domain-containing protein [Clostridium sp.]|nr:DUF3284 domain-containing protein [Clostridium sp.]